ncbi:MAG: hypothetical protein V4732_20815 [Pseudomonadota bacterium]
MKTMNRRINKKQHKKYLPDIGIEICQDKQWQSRLSHMEVGESMLIESGNIPESFYGLNQAAGLHNLSFEVTRVELSSIPASESSWLQISEKTIALAFCPTEFKRPVWYAVIN